MIKHSLSGGPWLQDLLFLSFIPSLFWACVGNSGRVDNGSVEWLIKFFCISPDKWALVEDFREISVDFLLAAVVCVPHPCSERGGRSQGSISLKCSWLVPHLSSATGVSGLDVFNKVKFFLRFLSLKVPIVAHYLPRAEEKEMAQISFHSAYMWKLLGDC